MNEGAVASPQTAEAVASGEFLGAATSAHGAGESGGNAPAGHNEMAAGGQTAGNNETAGGDSTDTEKAGQAVPGAQDYAISLPEHIALGAQDEALMDRFKHFCASTGLSQEQAQQAVDFYLAEQNSAMEGMHDGCEAHLRGLWKEKYPQNLARARQACVAFDKRMGGRLMPLVKAGLGNHPVFAEFMAEVGGTMAEDSFPGATSGAAPMEAMSTEEFLRKVVFKNK